MKKLKEFYFLQFSSDELCHEGINLCPVYLGELTCPFTRNIEAANNRKRARYEFLTRDIKDVGYQCKNLLFEIGDVTRPNRNKSVQLGKSLFLTFVEKVWLIRLKFFTSLKGFTKVAEEGWGGGDSNLDSSG